MLKMLNYVVVKLVIQKTMKDFAVWVALLGESIICQKIRKLRK